MWNSNNLSMAFFLSLRSKSKSVLIFIDFLLQCLSTGQIFFVCEPETDRLTRAASELFDFVLMSSGFVQSSSSHKKISSRPIEVPFLFSLQVSCEWLGVTWCQKRALGRNLKWLRNVLWLRCSVFASQLLARFQPLWAQLQFQSSWKSNYNVTF